METSISLRALEFCKYKGITAADFERLSGLANGMLKKLGDNTRNQTYLRISKAFPDLDIDWLRTGQGEMLHHNTTIAQAGDGSVFQNGHAGHDLNQTNNSEKLLLEFIDGMKSQNKLTEKAMEQTDRTLKSLEKALTNVEKAMEGTNKATEVTHKAVSEMSEQRKLMDRLVTIIENNKNNK